MDKAELSRRLAKETGLSGELAGRAVEAIFGVITEAVRAGRTASFQGFGAFGSREVGWMAAHRRRLPEGWIAAFRPSRKLQKEIAERGQAAADPAREAPGGFSDRKMQR